MLFHFPDQNVHNSVQRQAGKCRCRSVKKHWEKIASRRNTTTSCSVDFVTFNRVPRICFFEIADLKRRDSVGCDYVTIICNWPP